MTAYAAICDEGNLHKIAYRLCLQAAYLSFFLAYHGKPFLFHALKPI